MPTADGRDQSWPVTHPLMSDPRCRLPQVTGVWDPGAPGGEVPQTSWRSTSSPNGHKRGKATFQVVQGADRGVLGPGRGPLASGPPCPTVPHLLPLWSGRRRVRLGGAHPDCPPESRSHLQAMTYGNRMKEADFQPRRALIGPHCRHVFHLGYFPGLGALRRNETPESGTCVWGRRPCCPGPMGQLDCATGPL